MSTPPLRYLNGYPADTLAQVQRMLDEGRVGSWLTQRHPQAHGVRTDKVLYDYVQDIKSDYLRSTEPLSKVAFDSKLHVVKNALGTHTTVSRVQGNKLKSKREIRVASLFKDTPEPFLKMIVVHELAHLLEPTHSERFVVLLDTHYPTWREARAELNELPLAAN